MPVASAVNGFSNVHRTNSDTNGIGNGHLSAHTSNGVENGFLPALNFKQELGPLLDSVKQQTNVILNGLLDKKVLSPEDRKQARELIDLINEPGENFKTIQEKADTFIKNNQFVNLPLVNHVLTYINTQLTIMEAAMRHYKAQNSDGENAVRKGMDALRKSNPEQFRANLQKINVSPVFTAHPTNLNRSEVYALLDNAFQNSQNLKDLCEKVWEEQKPREERPTVRGEAKTQVPQLQNALKSIRRANEVVKNELESKNEPILNKSMVTLGNWVGGDRDGNPNIDAKTLMDVVKINSEVAFTCLKEKIALEKDNKTESLCGLLIQAGHQQKLDKVRQKLDNTQRYLLDEKEPDSQLPRYQCATEMVEELRSLDVSSLSETQQTRLMHKLDLLQKDAETAGFHGASTDVRQNSEKNQETVSELLHRSGVCSNYTTLSEIEKQAILNGLLTNDSTLLDKALPVDLSLLTEEQIDKNAKFEKEFQKEIELIKSYKTIHDKFGPQALQNCITANTETLSDMLEVMVLLKHAGLATHNSLSMNVVPLIETVPDLKNATKILRSMLENPWYSTALKGNGNQQQIMVGYSDSNRMDGPLASSWGVHKATTDMQEIAKGKGADLHFFHGRGGTEARGSGDSYSQEILASNGGTLSTGMRQTEQGEEVPKKFGKSTSDENLFDMLSSVMDMVGKGDDKQYSMYKDVMDDLAGRASDSYQELYNDPNLSKFYQQSTPINFVGQTKAGSRPASRASSTDGSLILGKLRAIPWVACWYQSGSLMPAFYGTGHAIASYIQDGANESEKSTRLQTLQTMYQQWPFFKTFIDRTSNALGAANMEVARAYSELAPEASRAIFDKIKNEYDLVCEQILYIKGSTDQLTANPQTWQKIQATAPLTRGAQALQIALINAFRQGNRDFADSELVACMVQTMQGIGSPRFG